MSRRPRQSLFEAVSYDDRPQKLQPNLFAQLARLCFRRAYVVVVFWSAILLAGGYFAAQNISATTYQPIAFAGTSSPALHLQTLQTNFPHVDRLSTVTLTNRNSELLIEQRDAFLQSLKNQTDLFDLVFAPGTGEYYDSHAILYLTKAEIEQRVAYALSLRPLFAAIAQAPSADSLATLVGEVSASIKQGRDPQGLDELFLQSASSLQALMQGKNAPVNWIKIANLDAESLQNSTLILVVPREGKEAQATTAIDAAIAQIVSDKSTTVTFQHPAPEIVRGEPQVPAKNRVVLLVAMAALLTMISVYSVLGRLGIILSIGLPMFVGMVLSLVSAVLLLPENVMAVWPVYIAVGLVSVVMAARYSFAFIEALSSGRAREIAAMFAAQQQGSGLMWQAAIAIFVWAGFFVHFNSPTKYIAVVAEIGVLAALLATLTLVPAISKIFGSKFTWGARLWMEPLLDAIFNTRLWRGLRTVLTLATIGLGCVGFYFAVAQTKFESQQNESNKIVNILAPSLEEAQSILLKLKSIPEANSVRWLGAFLPQDIEAKQAVLATLKEQFPRIGSLKAQSVDDLRNQILTLQDSLREIAAEPATRPELRKAADAFRHSLELLSGTSTNVEIVEVENKLFSRFNTLSGRADQWAGIEKPNLESLDKNLKTLFLSADNVYRIEVMPAPGQSNVQLAKVLSLNGLPVAHESLVATSQISNALSSFELVLIAALVIGLLGACFAIGEGTGIVSLFATSAVVFTVLAGAIAWLQVKLTIEILMIVLAIGTLLYCLIATAFIKAEITDEGMPDALHAVEAWLPTIIAINCAVPIYLLNIEGAKRVTLLVVGGSLIATLTIGFLLRPICLFLRRGN